MKGWVVLGLSLVLDMIVIVGHDGKVDVRMLGMEGRRIWHGGGQRKLLTSLRWV
jgi:hypothetical protein